MPIKYKIGQIYQQTNSFRRNQHLICAVIPCSIHSELTYIVAQDLDNGKVFAHTQVKDDFANCGSPKLDQLLFDPQELNNEKQA